MDAFATLTQPGLIWNKDPPREKSCCNNTANTPRGFFFPGMTCIHRTRFFPAAEHLLSVFDTMTESLFLTATHQYTESRKTDTPRTAASHTDEHTYTLIHWHSVSPSHTHTHNQKRAFVMHIQRCKIVQAVPSAYAQLHPGYCGIKKGNGKKKKSFCCPDPLRERENGENPLFPPPCVLLG